MAQSAEREENSVLEHREEPAHLVGVVVERAVFGLVVERQVELEPEVPLVSRRLNELTRACPDDGRAAAELLSFGAAGEVVVDRRTKIVFTLNAAEDVAVQDQVDPVVGMKAKLAVRGVAENPLSVGVTRSRWRKGGWTPRLLGQEPRIAGGPAEAELKTQSILDGAEL